MNADDIYMILLNFFRDNTQELFIESFSVFAGFISAFILQIKLEKRTDKKNKINIITGIQKELQKIYCDLNTISNYEYGFNLYDCSYWESVLYSGVISLLESISYYNDLLSLYNFIKSMNQWEQLVLYSLMFNTCNENDILIENIKLKRIELKDKINEMLSNFDN